MRNQYKVLAEKYQAINEDVAKTGFDRFAEVYEKINTAVKTLDRLYKEYNEKIEPFRVRFRPDQSNRGMAAIKSFQTSFTKKHNLQESEIHLVSIAVADTFSIPISALFGKSRKYPRKYAFAIWIYICHMDLKFTLTDLSAYLHCHMSTISKAKMLMEKLANDSAFDQKIHEKLAQSRQKFLQLNNTTSL